MSQTNAAASSGRHRPYQATGIPHGDSMYVVMFNTGCLSLSSGVTDATCSEVWKPLFGKRYFNPTYL